MGKVDLGKAFNRGWEIFSTNMVPMIVGTLLLAVISPFTLFILMPALLGGLVLMIKKSDEGQSAEIGDLFGAFNKFGTLFLSGLIAGLAIFVGSIACGIGAFFTGSIVIFMIPLIIDKDMSAGEAWSASWNAWKKNIGGFLVLMLVVGLLSGAGSVGMGIGALFTAPLGMCVTYAAYKQVFGDAAEAVPEPLTAPAPEPPAEG